MVGDFLQAAIRDGCQTAWAAIGGGTNVVERVEVNDPSDNTFHTSKLPALFVYREARARKRQAVAADMSYRSSQVTALWIPQLAVQAWKANREAFFHGVECAVLTAVERARATSWTRAGDSDPFAAAEGSDIGTATSLLRPLYDSVEFEDFILSIDILNQPTKNYPALKMTFLIWEQAIMGGLGTLYDSHVDVGITNSAGTEMGTVEDLP